MACVIPLLHLLVVGLIVVPNARAQELEGFWSVDCGSTGSFTDPKTNLTWVGDSGRMFIGESHKVATNASSLSRELITLRAFPSLHPRKNCFTFYLNDSQQILVRAYFYYGNYDGQETPPKFNLEFDGNTWSMVVTSMDRLVMHEVIYVTKGTSTNICLARIQKEHHPFVSAIEVRTLRSDMYRETGGNQALYPVRFVAFGAAQLLRYPLDKYDRIYHPSSKTQEGYSYALHANNATYVNTSEDSDDDPPPALFRNAAAALGGPGSNLTITFAYLPTGRPINSLYINLYFTEVTKFAGSNQTRSFDVYFDGVSDDRETVKPKFGVSYESAYYPISMTTNNNNLRLDLVPDNSLSTLPPIISGMEVFMVSDWLSNGTNQQDVDSLNPLKTSFKALSNWTGDPCFPEGYNWEWIGCTVHNYSARITQLLLGGYELSGSIPDVSSFDALDILDLHDNQFTGSVPEFLGSLTMLKILNLADNDLSEIPSSILSNTNLQLNYTGNPKLCNRGEVCVKNPNMGAAAAPNEPKESCTGGGPTYNSLMLSIVFLSVIIYYWPLRH